MTEANRQVPMTSQPRQAPLKPEEATAPGEDTVTMVFPNPVNLTTNDGRLIRFNAGINEVPVSIADHQYLRLSGVKRHDKTASGWRNKLKPQPAKADAVMSQSHVDFMRSNGIEVADVHDAQRQFDALSADEQQEFLREAGDFAQGSQYMIQRRVQDKQAGAREPAPANQEDGPGGPEPAGVNELIREGTAAGAGQPGTGREVAQRPVAKEAQKTDPTKPAGQSQTPQVNQQQQTGAQERGRDLEFERAHPGSFNRGMEMPDKSKQQPAGQQAQAGQQTQRSTTSSAKPPENRGPAKTEDKK